jgi:hypothetical protein
MDKKIEKAINEYQCPGCSVGPYLKNGCDSFKKRHWSESCDAHSAGTSIGLSIKIFLGMPTGFNRTGTELGEKSRLNLDIFKSFDDIWEKDGEPYDKFNIPVWKHLNENGHTLVRGLSPRNNAPFLHVILEDCMDKIDCFEVSKELIAEMD